MNDKTDREWQGAFFDAVYEAWHSAGMDVLGGDWNTFALTLEAKLKEKNDCTTDREIMQMALNDLEALVAYIKGGEPDLFMQVPSIEALRERLAQPEIEAALAPERELPWLRAIDEAMIVHHIGVADPADDYETAKRKVNNLLCHAQDIGAYFAKQAEPEQELVVVIKRNESGQIIMQTPDGNPFDMSKYIGAKLYTAPQQRKPLTDEESNRLVMEHLGPHALTGGKMSVYDAFLLAIRATEAKLKEKNT